MTASYDYEGLQMEIERLKSILLKITELELKSTGDDNLTFDYLKEIGAVTSSGPFGWIKNEEFFNS